MAKRQRLVTSKRSDADRRVRQADRLSRVLKILELIQGHGRWDAAALARELECSERTVHRYLDVLQFAGVHCSFDREASAYRLRPDFKFPVLNLTNDELLGQSLAAAVTRAPGLDVNAGGQPATRKIAAASGADATRLLEQAAELVQVLDLKLVDHRDHRETIKTIQWALINARQLAGQYDSPYDEGSKRVTLHPYRLCLVRQAWYLVARPADEETPKTYRVTRFKSLRMLDKPAEVPSDFDLAAYFGNAWAVFRGEQSYDVEIHFAREAATQVTETRWHHTQQVERHKDGSVTLKFTVDGLEEILWWLLGWAGFVRVVKPHELRDLFSKQLNCGLDLNDA